MPRRAAAGAFGLFALIGTVQALYGPALPGLQRAFDVTPASAALVVSAHFVGGAIGVPLWGAVLRHLPTRLVLAAATAALSAGCLGVALAPAWVVVLASAFVIGVGFGGLDLGLNVLFATGFGTRSAAMLNLLNASFGIGAVAGPLAVGLLPADTVRPLFAASGALGLTLLPLIRSIPDRRDPGWTPAAPAPGGRTGGLAVAFIVMYVLYVGVETGVGAWEPTHLAFTGMPAAEAALLTSLFWAALTVGRVLAAPISLRFAPDGIVLTTLTLATGSLALTHVSGVAPAAYAMAGLALAPVFPTGLAWLNGALPSARGATVAVVAGAMLGGVVFPAVIGRAVGTAGPALIPTALTAIAATTLAVALGIRRTVASRPRPA